MCGLTAAYAADLRLNEINVLKTLLQLSDLRGGYGAGEVSVNKKKECHLIKDNFSAYDLINLKQFEDRMKDDISLVIGHSRYPTKGKQTRAHAHPHSTAKVVGVHNGTLRAVMEKPVSEVESDSRTLFEAISNHGIEEVISKSTGAYALMWIDKEAKEFRFLRNPERPLFFAKIKPYLNAKEGEFRSIFFSSEMRMLKFALDRSGLMQEAVFGDVPINKMFCFPLCPEAGPLPNPTVIDIPECKRHYYPARTDYSDFQKWDHEHQHWKGSSSNRLIWKKDQFYEVLPSGQEIPWNKQKTARTDKDVVSGFVGKNVVPFGYRADSVGPSPLEAEILKRQLLLSDHTKTEIPGPFDLLQETDFSDDNLIMKETCKGHFVSLTVFQEYLDSGCAWCNRSVDLSESRIPETRPHFFSKAEFLCSECQVNDEAAWLVGLDQMKVRQ